jgi:hypothetical protein
MVCQSEVKRRRGVVERGLENEEENKWARER